LGLCARSQIATYITNRNLGELEMFRAVGRYFRALGYLMTGRVDRARQALSTNPDVVRATFDRVIQEKKKRIHHYKDAVAAMIAQEEKKKSTLRRLTDEITKLRKLRDGAAAMARKAVERHNGDVEAVKSDPDYLKSQSAFKDFSSSLSEKESRITDLESDVGEITESITGHKTQLESLLREIETVKQEKHQTVAEIITAKEEREIADMITGISNDRTSEELQELRDIRDKAKAGARISREMAGTDVARSEAEFLEYADKSVASDEFDALIGLTKQESESDDSTSAERTQIPES
jgi:phage shock protein A